MRRYPTSKVRETQVAYSWGRPKLQPPPTCLANGTEWVSGRAAAGGTQVDKERDSPGILALQDHSMRTWPRQDQIG